MTLSTDKTRPPKKKTVRDENPEGVALDAPESASAPTASEVISAPTTQQAPQPPAPPVPEKAVLSRVAIIIDDEPANRDFLERLVQQAKYTTYGASSGKEALQVVGELEAVPGVIFVDSELPDMKGLELIKVFRQKYPHTKLIMATMLDERSLIASAFECGCDVFLVKPHGFMELFKRLQQLDSQPEALTQLVIDLYGPRPYRK